MKSKKVCEFCGEELPVSEFYNNHNNPDGLTTNCKRCLKERRASNALNEILKFVNFNVSFSNEKLKKSNKTYATLKSYLHDLTDLGLLEHNESENTYNLIWNDKLSTFCERYDIQSSKIPKNINNSSSHKENVNLKLCDFCGEELPVSEFYNNHNNPDGLTTNCKRCLKERRASNALNEILKFVNFNVSFSNEKLKKSNKTYATLKSYLHDLTDLGLLEHNESENTYNLIWNDKLSTFCERYDIQSSKIPKNINNSSSHKENVNLKLCDFCGEELPVSEFYNNHNNPDGLTTNCKRCLKERRASNALNEILKFVNFNISFSNEKLKKSNKTYATLKSYLHDLTDLGLLEHNESENTYNLIWNDKLSTFCEKYEIQSSKIPGNVIENLLNVETINTNVCKVCGEELKSSDYINRGSDHFNSNVVCRTCTNEQSAINGLSEIMSLFSINSTFPKSILEMKSKNSKDVVKQYLDDMIELNLLDYHNKEKQIYTFILNNDIISFCSKHDIELPKSYKFQMDYSIKSKFKSQPNSKICDVCGENLPLQNYYKDEKSVDGLSAKCVTCFKKDNAAMGLEEIIKYVKTNEAFSKDLIMGKSTKLPTTINKYLKDLTDMGLLGYSETIGKYNLIFNNKLSSFCKEYNISLKNQIIDDEKLDNMVNNDLTNDIIQMSEETGSYFILEFKKIVRKSEIMPILTYLEDKIFDLKVIELLIKLDQR